MTRVAIPGVLVAAAALAAGACSTSPSATSSSTPPSPAVVTVMGGADAVPMAVTSTDAATLVALIADGSAHLTKLPPDYLHQRLLDRDASPSIAAAFEALRVTPTPAAHADLIRVIELDFVHAADTSSLDLLGPELGERLRAFDWQSEDYPGGPEGANEEWARTLADALDLVTPERRANRARHAVIVREEATPELWDYMLGQWAPVPGEPDWKLNRHAVAAYVRMREAAAADGVTLTILSGHRDPQRAAANAARVGNSYAVASFSSHSLGLAIDFRLPRAESESGNAFRLTTAPMAEVVDMRRSPAHKWLHLHGHRFGWFPFQHEPWHWEFNPPGFRGVFFADRPSGPPPREAGR